MRHFKILDSDPPKTDADELAAASSAPSSMPVRGD
jgi:hypothetical protein